MSKNIACYFVIWVNWSVKQLHDFFYSSFIICDLWFVLLQNMLSCKMCCYSKNNKQNRWRKEVKKGIKFFYFLQVKVNVSFLFWMFFVHQRNGVSAICALCVYDVHVVTQTKATRCWKYISIKYIHMQTYTSMHRVSLDTSKMHTKTHTREASDCRCLSLFSALQLSPNKRGFMSLPFILPALRAAFPEDQTL